MRAVLVPPFAAWLVIIGCGGSPPPPGPRTPAVAPEPRERAEPPPPRPVASRPAPTVPELPPWGDSLRLLRRPQVVIEPEPDVPPLQGGFVQPLRGLELSSERKSDYWSPCVRAFVQTQPAAARELLGEALSMYSTSCSTAPSRVEFRVPRVRRSAPAQSQLGLIGALERSTGELALRAAYHGEPIRAERITVIADGVWWSSPRIDFERDTGGEVATLPLTRTLARVVRRAIDARDALLRFESAKDYEDVAIGDELKQELRVMLDALDAINRP